MNFEIIENTIQLSCNFEHRNFTQIYRFLYLYFEFIHHQQAYDLRFVLAYKEVYFNQVYYRFPIYLFISAMRSQLLQGPLNTSLYKRALQIKVNRLAQRQSRLTCNISKIKVIYVYINNVIGLILSFSIFQSRFSSISRKLADNLVILSLAYFEP